MNTGFMLNKSQAQSFRQEQGWVESVWQCHLHAPTLHDANEMICKQEKYGHGHLLSGSQ